MHQGTPSHPSLFAVPLPDGDQPKSKKGIHPRAKGEDGRIAEKGTVGNGEKSRNGACVKGIVGR